MLSRRPPFRLDAQFPPPFPNVTFTIFPPLPLYTVLTPEPWPFSLLLRFRSLGRTGAALVWYLFREIYSADDAPELCR